MFLYYITDRTQFPGGEHDRRRRLLDKIAEAASCGVDYVQLREKDLSLRDLEALALQAMERIRAAGGSTRLLINSRTDIAIATGADGVHLRSKDVSPADARTVWRAAGRARALIVAVSCHTAADVRAAEESGADFVVFGPTFGKKDALEIAATGLESLRNACRGSVPVIALGGITADNAVRCAEAGAKGIAGIRLFQQNNLAEVVAKLRG